MSIENFDDLHNKLKIEIEKAKESRIVKIFSIIGALGVIFTAVLTYNVNVRVHQRNSAVQYSTLVGGLNQALTDEEAKRDVAIIAMSRLINPFENESKIPFIDSVAKPVKNIILVDDKTKENQAYMVYEITKRLSQLAQSEYKQVIRKSFANVDAEGFNTNTIESYGLVHNKHIKAAIKLDKVLEVNDKQVLGVNINSNNYKNFFFNSAVKLYEQAGMEIANNIVMSKTVMPKTETRDDDFVLETHIEENNNNNHNNDDQIKARRIDGVSRRILQDLADDRVSIFIRYDRRITDDNPNLRPKILLLAFLEEAFEKKPALIDRILQNFEKIFEPNKNDAINIPDYYIPKTFFPIKVISEQICKSQIRYFIKDDEKLAKEFQRHLRNKLSSKNIENSENPIFKTLATKIEPSFELKPSYQWAMDNKIDVQDRQLELLLMYKEPQQENSKASSNCETTK